MEWSKTKNILLCHEILQIEPYKAKEKTVNRAQLWQKVADNLNKLAEFKVTKRSVQDHYKVLVDKFKKKTSQELQASGISPEPTELDRLLEEIVERAEASEQSRDHEDQKAQEKIRKEQEQAKDVRLKAMESLSETKKRTDAGDGASQPKPKKRRSNGTEMVAYLRERAVEENNLKEKDIEIRSMQVEKEAARQQLLDRQHNSLMELLLKQQQQQQHFQQQQQQQFMQMQTYMTQQQQQQHQMLMAILEKRN